jgi:hypothetical protein
MSCDRPNHDHCHVPARCKDRYEISLCLDLICDVQFCLTVPLEHVVARLYSVDLAQDHFASSPGRNHTIGVARQDCSLRSFASHTRYELRNMSFYFSFLQRLFMGEGT